MSRCLFLLLFMAHGLLFAATVRKTVYIDRMNGFENFIADALRRQDVPVEVILEDTHPHLRIELGKKFSTVDAEILYNRQTGRTNESVLTAIDVKSRKAIVTFEFHLGDSDSSMKRSADEFAKRLKKRLK